MPISFADLNEQEKAFVRAEINQRHGLCADAVKEAKECLRLLWGKEMMEETASGHVVFGENGQTVCLPDFLHTETALQRFRALGISV